MDLFKTLVARSRRHRERAASLMRRADRLRACLEQREARLAEAERAVDARLERTEALQRQIDEWAAASRRVDETLADLAARADAEVNRRQALVERIDSQLNDRQLRLVTDILRAESRHLELMDAVERVDGVLRDLRSLVGEAGLDRVFANTPREEPS